MTILSRFAGALVHMTYGTKLPPLRDNMLREPTPIPYSPPKKVRLPVTSYRRLSKTHGLRDTVRPFGRRKERNANRY